MNIRSLRRHVRARSKSLSNRRGGGSDVETQAGGILAGLAMIAVTNGGSAQLKLAMEDRADPNPHQVSLGVELAGLSLGVVIS
jgi:hypothetical protein